MKMAINSNTQKKKFSTVTLVLVIELIIMLALLIVITVTVSKRTRQNSIDHMATITDERAHIIDNFVQNSEKTLKQFCRAEQVTNLLNLKKTEFVRLVDKESTSYGDYEKESKVLLDKAQAFTEEFGKDIDGLEGVWIGTWETLVLTHTSAKANPDVIGMITRKDPGKLKELQDALLEADKNGNGVFNTGIIISPASGKQILSMYKAVYDKNGNPLGLVGLGIFTEGLISELENLTIRGVEDSTYCMVNVADNTYIFNTDKELITKETENEEILKLTKRLKGTKKPDTDNFTYEKDKKSLVSTYSYMDKYGWILMLDAPKSEVYKLTNSMRLFLSVFGILILGLLLIFHFISKHQEKINRRLSSQIAKNERTKKSLNTAMFKDILTEVNNRVSFSMDLSKLETEPERTHYFAMFNISSFSEINNRYGTDAGDKLLLSVAQSLTKIFETGQVYRTGSDEFVVSIEADSSSEGYSFVMNNVNTAHAVLMTDVETPAGTVAAEYRIAVVKKTENINTSIISTLKEMTKRSGNAVFGQIVYNDLDVK